jgi:hypothetical protein
LIHVKVRAGFRGMLVGADRNERERKLEATMRPPFRPPAASDGCGLSSRFGAGLAEQDALCRALEDLADSLPAPTDTHAALMLSRRLCPTLRRCHHLEETAIFPSLARARRELGPVLERLCAEHREDEDHAGDVREAIETFVARRSPGDAEKLGYMLRCIFVPLRRHVAFDRDYILPLYREIGAGRGSAPL